MARDVSDLQLPLFLFLLSATPNAELAPALERVIERIHLPAEEAREAKGLIDLLAGRKSAARLALESAPQLATYLAMAELDGAGGIGRAREVLSKSARADGPGSAMFLAALAFQQTGDQKTAHELLAKALAKSGPLDEAFAPDPAEALVRAVKSAAKAEKIELARVLLAHGRRSAAIQLAKEIEAKEIAVEAWAPIDPRRALASAEDPTWRARIHWKLGEKEKAKAALDEAKGETAEILRLRAAILLDEHKDSEAFEAAQAAARLDPKSDEALRLVAESLFATGEYDRAHAFAEELLNRKPIEIDPYGLLARVQTARKHQREVAALEARSKGHQGDRAKIEMAQHRREVVLSAVRDSESGLGITGLVALRGSDPELSLPIDLALAKLATAGTARAARERVLAACADHLRKLLSPQGTWDRVRVDVSPYGKAQKVDAPLSAADPGRCGGKVLRK
jgi:tetratricopeptide (TPR) repeat protein